MGVRERAALSSKWNLKSLYVVDSFSVLSEYVNQCPNKIRYLVGDRNSLDLFCRQNPKVKALCHQLEDWVKVYGEAPSRARVWALVSIAVKDENEWYPSLEKTALSSVIVAVDHITDPRNFGAIVRSAAFFGVSSIIFPKDRQVSISDVAVRSAQGGFAHIAPVLVTNLARSLRELKKYGYWIVGTDGEEGSTLDSCLHFDKTVIVFGSESKGISRVVENCCDVKICIRGLSNSVGSLNVSVAAGIVLNHIFLMSGQKFGVKT